MSLVENTAPAGGEALPDTWTPPSSDNGPLSVREAARSLSDARYKRDAELNRQAEAPEQAAEPNELSPEDNAAPPQEAPGETPEAEPAEALPPIDPPRSWTKDEKERFASLPRDTQEYIAEREQDREREIRRSQNEAAEKTKAVTAKEQQLEALRQQYESQLPQIAAMLQSAQAGEFGDIQSISDVEKLSVEDPLRYLKWTAHQSKVAAVQREMQQAQERQTKEFSEKFSKYADEQDKLAIEEIPELADNEKGNKLRSQVQNYLSNIGVSQDDLAASWNGKAGISLRDAKWQRVLADAARYQEVKTAGRNAVAKPLPPVQRPGVAKAPGADKATQIQALQQQLSSASGQKAIRIAAQLMRLERG